MKLHRGLSVSFLAGAGVFVIACAAEPEDDSFQRRDAFVSNFCDIVANCCEKTFGAVVTAEDCKKNVSEFDIASTEDDAARTACIAQLQAATTKYMGQFCQSYGRAEISACPDIRRAANKGQAKPGEPCKTPADCAPSFDGPVQCNSGGCQVLKRGKEGDLPCTATDDGGNETSVGSVPGPTAFVCHVAEDNVYCDKTTNTCTAPKPLGAECTSSDECIRTAYCNETSKKCQVKKSSESACEDSSECQAPFHCDEGFCRHDLDDGAECKDGAMCKSGACVDSKCAAPASKDPRLEPVCKAAPPPPQG